MKLGYMELVFIVDGSQFTRPRMASETCFCLYTNVIVLFSGKGYKKLIPYTQSRYSLAIPCWIFSRVFTIDIDTSQLPACRMGAWWRHQMETFSVLLALCAGNSAVTGEFPSQRSVTRNFDVFFDLRMDKRLSLRSKRQWFEKPSCSLWCHCNGICLWLVQIISCNSHGENK